MYLSSLNVVFIKTKYKLVNNLINLNGGIYMFKIIEKYKENNKSLTEVIESYIKSIFLPK